MVNFHHQQLERLAQDIRFAQFCRVKHEQELTSYKAAADKLADLLAEWDYLKAQGYPVEGYDLNEAGEDPSTRRYLQMLQERQKQRKAEASDA